MSLTKLKKAGNPVLQTFQVWSIVCLMLGVLTGLPARAIASSLQLGIEAFYHQDYPAAVQYFDQAIAADQELDKAYSNRCMAHLLMNLPEQAVEDCSAALRLNPAQHQLRFYRGLAHYRRENYKDAIADFTQYLQQHPQDARTFYNRGLARFAYGAVESAIADYHQAMTYLSTLTPLEMSNLYNDLGVAYLADRQPEAAIAALDIAIALDHRDPRAYFNRGCACRRQGQYAAALKDFERVLGLAPDHAGTYLNRGIVKQQIGDRMGAIADLEAAISRFQNQGDWAGVHQARVHLQQVAMPTRAIG